MRQLREVNTNETSEFQQVTDTVYKEFKRKVVFTAAQILQFQAQLQLECNRLQDEMDSFNASTFIDFKTPLI